MMDRLYIDGVLVDIPDKTDITLSLVSNVFTDLSKISGNTTYTVKLPKTPTNRNLFGYADRLDERSGWMYREHEARFYRDGVELIRKGKASLQGATDEEYEIVVMWGVCEQFQRFLKEGLTLQDLPPSVVLDYVEDNPLMELSAYMQQGYGYADIDTVDREDSDDDWGNEYSISYGGGNRKKDEKGGKKIGAPRRMFVSWTAKQPSVTAAWLLSQIEAMTGVEFRWTGDAKTFIDTLSVLCVTRDANEYTYVSGFLSGSFQSLPMNADRTAEATVLVSSNSIVFGNLSNETKQRIDVVTSSKVHFSCHLSVYQNLGNVWQCKDVYMVYDTSIGVVVIHSDGTEDMYTFGASGINRIPGEMVTANRFTETIDTEGDIDLVVGDKVCFRVQSTIGRDRLIIRSIDSFAGTFKMVAVAGKEVPYGAKFPITKNLPNIKIVDFVKFLSCITGTFARQVSDDGVVEFVAFDDIDMQDAEDWTGRIVASSDKNIADGLTFKMSDWAMMNWYRWKEDKATGSYDGMLYVDDDTLEKERDVITFPFAASDGGNAPLFKYEWVQDDDGNWNREETFSKCEPRIYTTGDVTVVSGGVEHHYPKLDFGIDMQRIIDERYMLLSDMLNGCKVIEEKIMIRTSEIAAFDETHPVWLGQYGAYFLVIELRAGNDGTATAKMVKLNIRS